MSFCLKITKIWHYIRTCIKTCIAIWFRKTSVYRNGLYISVCISRKIKSVSLCLVPFQRRQIVLFRKVWHFVVAYMWRKSWSYLHSYLNSPRSFERDPKYSWFHEHLKNWIHFLSTYISCDCSPFIHTLLTSKFRTIYCACRWYRIVIQ